MAIHRGLLDDCTVVYPTAAAVVKEKEEYKWRRKDGFTSLLLEWRPARSNTTNQTDIKVVC